MVDVCNAIGTASLYGSSRRRGCLSAAWGYGSTLISFSRIWPLRPLINWGVVHLESSRWVMKEVCCLEDRAWKVTYYGSFQQCEDWALGFVPAPAQRCAKEEKERAVFYLLQWLLRLRSCHSPLETGAKRPVAELVSCQGEGLR